MDELTATINLPGAHNRENAEAALLATASFMSEPISDFLTQRQDIIKQTFQNFQGLPHRLQFVRGLNNVEYYDDNYSSAFPALDVALKTFEDRPTVLIAGGKDRGLDLSDTKERIFNAPNLMQAILIGETKDILAKDQDLSKFQFAETLEEAVLKAKTIAEESAKNQPSVVVMSPGAASFDMFKNFQDRGEQFQQIVKNLKGEVWTKNK